MSRFNNLDGLKGISASIVYMDHFLFAFYPALLTGKITDAHNAFETKLPGTLLDILYSGNFSVCIFFILSAYLLSYKYIRTKDVEVLRSGAFRRYFRLVLPVFISVLSGYFLMKYSLLFNRQAAIITKSKWFASAWNFKPSFGGAINEGLIGVFFKYKGTYNNVLWIMTYEMYGSLMIYFLLSLFGNNKNRIYIYIFIIILSFNTYYFAFMLGLILCELMNGSKNYLDLINKSWINILFVILGVFLGSYPLYKIEGTIYEYLKFNSLKIDYYSFYHIIGAILLIIAVLNSRLLNKILSFRPFVLLGRISFEIYLFHFIIIGSISSFIFIKLIPFYSYNISCLIVFIFTSIITISLSAIMYKILDLKGINLSNKLYNNISQ